LLKRQKVLHKKKDSLENIVKVSSKRPDSKIIETAGEIITKKGVVVFPAQYFYGIAVDALDVDAAQKVFNIKKRNIQNPLLALIKDKNQLEQLVDSIPDIAEKLIEKYWPGNVTLIFNAAKHIPDIITAKTGKIGLRMPLHPVAKALVNQVNRPITGTSANLSGQPACNTINTIDPFVLKKTDIILDAGKLKPGLGSTVIDVTKNPIKIVRQGQISESDIISSMAE
jgi:L-threonylcarbamoyladenylate synthase